MNNFFLEYLNKINTGAILVPEKIKIIYNRLNEELLDPNSKWIFDLRQANRPIEFIEAFCKHSKGKWAGKPVKLEIFQKAFISILYGIISKETGLRRFKQAFFMVGRKNGKSTMSAGIALYNLIIDEEGAEVYTLASKLDQAKVIFDTALSMVRSSPELNKLLKKRKSDLYFKNSDSILKPLSNKSNTLDGLNASCAIIDELHAIRDRETYEVMYQSMASREQPLLIMITTAGTVRENIFDQIFNYANGIIENKINDDSFLPIIYELDSKDEWLEPDKWIKANPGLGVIKKVKDLEDKVNKAKQDPMDIKGLLTKDFNIRENSVDRWLDFDTINRKESFSLEDFRNKWFIGGVDLSEVGDLTCATALFIDKETENIFIDQMYWIPKKTFEEHLKTDKAPYDKWRDRGYLTVCDSNKVDYSLITKWFLSLVKDYGMNPFMICYDPWNGTYWEQEMKSKRFPLKECRQGAKTLSTPMKHLKVDLEAGKLNLNNNPILKWCLYNTDIKTDDNGNIRPVKGGTRFQRIDGAVSLINAYVGLIENYQEFKRLS